jgi:N-methylhydantoinase A
VVVPHGAGVGSAIGLLDADSRIDVSMTRILPLAIDEDAPIAAIFAELEARAWRELKRVRADAAPRWTRRAYLRHAGQGFEINVRLPDGPIGAGYARACLEGFFDSYQGKYGYRDADAKVEGVDWQLEATLGGPGDAALVASTVTRRAGKPRPTASRTCYFPEATGWIDCKIVDRDGLAPGERVAGPAIIEERESTTVVLPGDVASLSERGHLVIMIGGSGKS